jgi:hypothetical protein
MAGYIGSKTVKLSTTAANVTGNITVGGTVDGRDVAADGVTADAALPKAGGALTGAVTTNSTFDGVDIATRDAVLTATTTTANAALPKSGGAVTGNVTFGDSNKAIFGAYSPLQIYHDGSNSYITEGGTGDLRVQADDLYVFNAAGNSVMISALDDGKVGLGFAGSEKLATTATGIDVIGLVNSDGLTVDGDTITANAQNAVTVEFNNAIGIISADRTGGNYAGLSLRTTEGSAPVERLGIAYNGNVTISENLGVNKAVTSSVALSVGSDAATTTSYGLEVCNNNSNTRFLVDGLGNSTFYGSDNSVTAKFTSAGSLSINGAAGSDKLHIKSGFVRIQAQEQTSGSHNQRYGVRWTQETDVEVARIEVERPAWGGAPSKMNFYTRTPANSVNETMTIDEYGRVGMPNQAWASVSSSTATTSSNYVPLNANAVANGGVTVGSTNRITVPVTGNYLVGFHMLSDDQSSTFVKTRKNGSDIPGMNGQNQTDTYDNFSIQNIVNLAANDYIQFFVAGGKVHGNPSYNRMYVYKLG